MIAFVGFEDKELTAILERDSAILDSVAKDKGVEGETHVRVEPIKSSLGLATGGIYRVVLSPQAPKASVSLILKILRPPHKEKAFGTYAGL